MEQVSTLFLKTTIIAFGLIVLAICTLVLPAGINSDSTGYYRPILIGLYIPAGLFFFALYQALKLLSYIDKNKIFSTRSVQTLKHIKLSSLVISSLFIVGMPYIYYAADKDDAPGVILIGLIFIGGAAVIAAAAGVFQRLLQNAIDIKSENDLTV